MTDEALAPEAAPGPSTDALTEQAETRGIEHKAPVEDPVEKGDTPPSPEKSRSDAIRKAIDDATKDEPKAKPEVKPEDAKADEGKGDGEDKPDAKDADNVDPDKAEGQGKATAFKDPPARFDDAAKKEWESVPESVRGAIHRASREMESGIEKYRSAAEEFERVREYADLAKQYNTDLPTALRNYVGLERLLTQNPIAGLEQIVENLGKKLPNGQPVTFRHIAEAYLSRSPVENDNAKLNARIRMMEDAQRESMQRQQALEREAQQRQLLESAQREMPRLEELRPAMIGLVSSGKVTGASDAEVLRAAYAEAERLYPAPNGAHTADPALAQTQRQTNPAGRKSVHGASNGDAPPSSKKLSRDDAIRKAMRDAGI